MVGAVLVWVIIGTFSNLSKMRKPPPRGCDLDAAVRLAQEALEYWPGLTEAQAVGANANQLLDQRKEKRRQIIEAIDARRFSYCQCTLLAELSSPHVGGRC